MLYHNNSYRCKTRMGREMATESLRALLILIGVKLISFNIMIVYQVRTFL